MTTTLQQIPSWSISKLHVFEKCPLQAKFKWIDKIPEPERPLPPGKTEHANDRGSRIHDAAEQYVRGNGPLIPEMNNYAEEFMHMHKLYLAGQVSLEGEWAFDKDWVPTQWTTGWVRLKLDAGVYADPTYAIVVDYKTGRKFGNEVKHAEQMQFYALSLFLRQPELERVTSELWYLNVDEITSISFTRKQAMMFWPRFTQRGLAMTEATEFPAKPNVFNCKWCPYGPDGTGDCAKGVSQNQFPKKKGR